MKRKIGSLVLALSILSTFTIPLLSVEAAALIEVKQVKKVSSFSEKLNYYYKQIKILEEKKASLERAHKRLIPGSDASIKSIMKQTSLLKQMLAYQDKIGELIDNEKAKKK
jgi:hypothetical protein